MEIVTVSPKFQIVIPRTVRDSVGILPGQKMHVFFYRDRIQLIPLKPIAEARGFLKGMNITSEQEQIGT